MTQGEVWMFIQLAWLGGQALYWWWMAPASNDEKVWNACINKETQE